MDALNTALEAIERAHADGLTATQVCALVDAARGVAVHPENWALSAQVRNLSLEQIRQALDASALELAVREQQALRAQTLLVRARHWLARRVRATADAIEPPPAGRRQQ